MIDRPKKIDVLLFTKHLSTMIKSGIPISEALSTLSEQTKSKTFRKIIENIHNAVENGQSLSASMKKYPKVFDGFYVNLIEVSEKSGTLEENLEFMSKELSKSYALSKRIKSAMLYPAVIFFAVTIMGGFIALFVLPQLVDFFDALEVDLPTSTKILLFVANSFKDYGIYIIITFVLFMVALRLILNSRFVKPIWHSLIIKLPFIGNFVATTQLAQFSRNLGILLKSGVPIDESIYTTAKTLSNLKYRKSLIRIAKSIEKGNGISATIDKNKISIFPPLVSKMIGVGEKAGNLDEALLYLGDFYEEEIDNITKNMTTILEPILLIVIGLVVGFVALSIITPIYELSGSIRR